MSMLMSASLNPNLVEDDPYIRSFISTKHQRARKRAWVRVGEIESDHKCERESEKERRECKQDPGASRANKWNKYNLQSTFFHTGLTAFAVVCVICSCSPGCPLESHYSDSYR